MAEINDRLYQLKLEKLETLRWERYREDPLFWLEHRFGEDPKAFQWDLWGPEYDNHVWDGDKNPLAEAWKKLAQGEHVGVEAGTGTAKTFWLSRVTFWFADCYPDSLIVTSAPKQDQLKLHLWAEITKAFSKFKKIRPKAELYKLRMVVEAQESDTQKKQNAIDNVADADDLSTSWQAVGFVAGTDAGAESATKAQGFHRKDMLIILEECAGMPMPIMTAFQNTSTGGNNVILAVGNPDSELDVLHQFCMQEDVFAFRVSAMDFPNVVLNEEVIAGAVTVKSIERRRKKYGEKSGLFQSRVHGKSPAESTDSLIKRSWIEEALLNEVVYDGSYNAVGVDVANSETGDKAATAWGRGNVLTEVFEFKCPNATHLAYNVMYDDNELFEKGYENYKLPTAKSYDMLSQCIGVDAVGVGVATVNAFVDNGYECIALQGGQLKEVIPVDPQGEPMYTFSGLRSQMYWELREDLRNGHLQFDIDNPALCQRIMVELTTPRFKVSSANVQVEKKEDIKKRLGGKSPNIADAIVYWNWARKGHYVRGGIAAVSAGQ